MQIIIGKLIIILKVAPVLSHHSVEVYRGRGSKALCILDLSISWRLVISSTLDLLCPKEETLKYPLYGWVSELVWTQWW
jgi:hypothetical protein